MDIKSEYEIEIMTMFGFVMVSFPETAWDEPADTIISAKNDNEGAEKAFRLFVSDFGIGVTGIRINPGHCSPVDLIRTLEINDSYNKDKSIVSWRILSGYVPGQNDDIYNPFEELEKKLFPEIILESSDLDGNGCLCQKCNAFFKLDLLIPDVIWEKVKPQNKAIGGGLLCASCIMKEIEKISDFSAYNLINCNKKDQVLESSDLDKEINKAATSPENDLPEPTELQKKSGAYKKGHIRIAGMGIAIENPAGSERAGTDPDGKKWSIKMVDHYGYLKSTMGADKDHVDVFINPDMDKVDIEKQPVYIVDQINKDGSFDEHKIVMGRETEQKAKKAYLSNYEKGWTGLGAITEMSMADFKVWVMDKKKTKKALVLESAYRDDYGGYGVLMAELPEAEAIVIRNFANSLPEADIASHPDTGEPWIEYKSHITIRYGLLPVDIKEIEEMVKSVSGIRGVYGNLGLFQNEKHDILFISAYSPDLIRLNHESKKLPGIESEYKHNPHVTVARLKKGVGEKYIGIKFFSGVNFFFNQVQYSDEQGNVFPIKP